MRTQRSSWRPALLATGVEPRMVMELLGHTTSRMTMERYGHALPERLQAAAEAVDSFLRGPAGISRTAATADAAWLHGWLHNDQGRPDRERSPQVERMDKTVHNTNHHPKIAAPMTTLETIDMSDRLPATSSH